MMTNSEFGIRNSESPLLVHGNLGGRLGIQSSEFKIQNSSMGECGATP